VNGKYRFSSAGIRLVISHNLDLESDAECIQQIDNRIPAVAHIHCQFGYYSAEQRKRIAAALKKVRVGIAPARFLQRYFAEMFPSVDWRVVYNGVDAVRFSIRSSEQRRRFRAKWRIPDHHKLIGIVGRLEKAKGLQIIREMCRQVGHYDVALLLQYPANARANDNEVALRLQRQNPEKIALLPDANPGSTTVIPYCDQLVSPSLSEACPLVVLEALTAGVPVMGTKGSCFYDELADIGIPGDRFFFLDLPGSCDTKEERSKLGVSSAVAREVAEALLTKAQAWPVSGDAERWSLSEKVKYSPISEDAMLRAFSRIYEEALA
jgi:glycosyltransferase involved in cell wall biosynthesis